MKKQYITIKKQLVLVSFIILSFCGFSQNNLQFSSVVFNSYSHNSSSTASVGTLVVPAGYVLKITSASSWLDNNDRSNMGQFSVGNHVLINDSRTYPNTAYTQPLIFPVWLPAGSYDVKADNISNFTTFHYTLSGIQFKVVSI